MISFGKRLRSLRLEHNMTQKELGNYFRLHKMRISQYELDKRQADDDIKIEFANYFDVSLDYLMGKSDIKQTAEQILDKKNNYTEFSNEAKKEIKNFIEYIRYKYKYK